MRGNPDAVASAYSLDDYRIADDLGGEAAYANLRDRAWARGIRLASDMVPNHMGIDSRWVTDHPEWFLSLPEPPFPAYTYTGPDLSSDPRVGIVLEDHYWDDTDAAVVFKRFDRETGDERYVYHGNDGTSFPWNDTAQLDFLSADVREHVIQAILDVARRFPVIRFDAAMVLARKHIQRLWWPLPGVRATASRRAPQYAISQEEFDRRMPNEFWREVVDRVAAEVPDTLLLAEAFWMLEGYFVRTLGMHRVYNSAFMHMLRDENGAGYRQAHPRDPRVRPGDPQALRELHEQPRRGDRARAVRQGRQVLRRRHGHGDAARAADARPRPGRGLRREVRDGVPARAGSTSSPIRGSSSGTEREVFPLLHRRGWFAEAHDFLLYDLVTDGGGVDESVLAYSNGTGPTRSLVIYHTRFGSTRRHDPRIRAVRAQVRERGEAPRPPIAGRGPRAHQRPVDVRDVP